MSNKLTLIINTEQKADDKKTAAFPRRRPRKLGRRRLQEGIRIFDLGYRLDGLVYAEIPFTDPNIADPVTFNANAASPFGAKADTSAHYDLIQTEVFTVAQSEWKNSYRQVDDDYTDNAGVSAGQFSITYKGQSYTLSAATSADVWSEGVFTPDQSPVNENFTIQPGRGDLVRTIGNSADYK